MTREHSIWTMIQPNREELKREFDDWRQKAVLKIDLGPDANLSEDSVLTWELPSGKPGKPWASGTCKVVTGNLIQL
ncbi:MAG: hypothetical protein GY938_16620 [Ketobacter sp.]|nr:hypothetical protein [Ketobacter sp.]